MRERDNDGEKGLCIGSRGWICALVRERVYVYVHWCSGVCMCLRVRESVCICVCMCEKERECEGVCV